MNERAPRVVFSELNNALVPITLLPSLIRDFGLYDPIIAEAAKDAIASVQRSILLIAELHRSLAALESRLGQAS